MIRIIFLLLFCTGVFAQNQLPGFEACPTILLTQNFNLTMFLGRWFQTQTYFPFPDLAKCVTATYGLNSDGSLQIIHSRIRLENMELVQMEGRAIFLGDKNEAKFVVNYPKINSALVWILDTDYCTYSINLSCADVSHGNALNVFILQKGRKTTAAIFEQIYNVLNYYQLNTSALIETCQDNCPMNY